MSRTQSRVGDPYDDAQLVRMVERLYDAGETLLAGGVHFRTLADELGRPHESMRDKLADLEADGKLERTYGIGENGKVWTYKPVEDSEVSA